MINPVEAVIAWNKDAGNTAGEVNVRQSAMYLGLQCEELAEKLLVVGRVEISTILDKLGMEFKKGQHDYFVGTALSSKEGRTEMLDADIDLIVVSIGAAMSQGANVHGAFAEVIRSNDSKRTDGKLLKDANGKIIKPAHYNAAELSTYVKD
jgi:predicted HAD superfamily Cof-like phosphohydrolase